MLRYLITALGSYGDVHPMVGLGEHLLARGHQVAVIANPHFQPVVEPTGVEFLPIGTAQEYDEFSQNPDLWHPIKGPLWVLRSGTVPYMRELYELLESHYGAGETVLVVHPLDLVSRCLQEKHDALMANMHLSPLMFRSLYNSPRMGTMLLSDWVPRPLKQFQYWLADKAVDRLVGPGLNALRSDLGLPPAEHIMSQWWYSPQLVLGMFPDWFAAPQPDWPPQVRLAGFPLWDQSSVAPLADEVKEFLNAGEPPIAFTPGSAMAFGRDFFVAAADACHRLNRRGVFLTKYPEQLPRDLPEGVVHFPFVPFSQLLPRAGALVHHGGIGTCAQGLAAGLPQVVMPMAFDQFDNAARLKRLGVADSLSRHKFRGPTLAAKLDALLSDRMVKENCRLWAEQIDGRRALDTACDLLDELSQCVDPTTVQPRIG